MGAFPNLSRNVPFCPRLSSFALLGARKRDKSGQKRTNGDKTGHFGTNWETPPFSIYPHLAPISRYWSLNLADLVAISRRFVTINRNWGLLGPFLMICGVVAFPMPWSRQQQKRRNSLTNLPQGPCHTKNTTVIVLHYGARHYGCKTLQREQITTARSLEHLVILAKFTGTDHN